jgi:hypothetical protein
VTRSGISLSPVLCKVPVITYRFRLRFNGHAPGVIEHPERRFEFELPAVGFASLSCTDADQLSKSRSPIFPAGGFHDECVARDVGDRIKDAILVTAARHRIGVDVGKNKSIGRTSTYLKDKVRSEHGEQLLDDVHGVSVYAESPPAVVCSVSPPMLYSPVTAMTFVEDIGRLLDKQLHLSQKEHFL